MVADLCAAGVSVRATKYDERNATPSKWAQKPSVQAEVAVNADFFDFPGWTLVNGRARGAGEDWPADKMLFEKRGYWEFGPKRAGWQPATLEPPPAPAVTEIVGAHNVIIQGGKSQAPDFDGDAVILTSHRRTGIGVSADRRYVYLYVSNASLGGAAMANTMLARAAEAGFPQLDFATNEDGGGSSQMYVADVGPLFETGRPVNNHLGVLAKGTGPATNCPFPAPVGALDAVSCEVVAGWAESPDDPGKAIRVIVSFDAPALAPTAKYTFATADAYREDLCNAIGSCAHGFNAPFPYGAMDGMPHEVHAYGVNATEGGPNAELGASPKPSMACAPPMPTGRKRWVTNPDVFKAWHFEEYVALLTVSDDVLATLSDDEDITAGPELVRLDDASGDVVLLDRGTRRPVPSPAVARAWHFDASVISVTSGSEVAALPVGTALRARPMLVKGSGPKIYLVDDARLPPEGSGGSGGMAGHGGGGGEASVRGSLYGTTDCGCALPGRATASASAAWLAGALGLALRLRRRRHPRR